MSWAIQCQLSAVSISATINLSRQCRIRTQCYWNRSQVCNPQILAPSHWKEYLYVLSKHPLILMISGLTSWSWLRGFFEGSRKNARAHTLMLFITCVPNSCKDPQRCAFIRIAFMLDLSKFSNGEWFTFMWKNVVKYTTLMMLILRTLSFFEWWVSSFFLGGDIYRYII